MPAVRFLVAICGKAVKILRKIEAAATAIFTIAVRAFRQTERLLAPSS